MRSPNIRGDTEMEISYNEKKPAIKKPGGRGGWREGGGRPLSEEAQIILDFLKTDKENVVFTYEDIKKTKAKTDAIRRTVNSKNIPVTVSRRANQIFIERKE